MSNSFKSNSRFSSLINDIPQQSDTKKNSNKENSSNEKSSKFNSFKSERIKDDRMDYRRNGRFNDRQLERYREERELELKAKKEFEEKEKDRIRIESLSMKNFPDLYGNIKLDEDEKKVEITDNSYTNIIKNEETVKTEETVKNEETVESDLQPGWILLKKDKQLNKPIIQSKLETKKEESDHEIGVKMANDLINQHKKRTEEFIELNGYDTWEKMYKSPNWQNEETYTDSEEDDTDEYEEDSEDDE